MLTATVARPGSSPTGSDSMWFPDDESAYMSMSGQVAAPSTPGRWPC